MDYLFTGYRYQVPITCRLKQSLCNLYPQERRKTMTDRPKVIINKGNKTLMICVRVFCAPLKAQKDIIYE